MNNLNDLPGVRARAILRPGSEPGTTKIDIEVQKRKVWNNYIYADNGGGYYSGRYRFGFNTEINNPTRTGDKIIVSGMLTDEDTDNYSVRYELPIGARAPASASLTAKPATNSHRTRSSTPSANPKPQRLRPHAALPQQSRPPHLNIRLRPQRHHRRIPLPRRGQPPLQLRQRQRRERLAHSLSGSRYGVNQFLQYSFIYWYGDISTDGGAYYDGGYHKFTADLLKIWYWGKFNARVRARGQLASRALDGSEQFFLGGINGVRAYANGDYYGDSAYTATGELRYALGIPGLELAAFVDVGAAKNLLTDEIDHLAAGASASATPSRTTGTRSSTSREK